MLQRQCKNCNGLAFSTDGNGTKLNWTCPYCGAQVGDTTQAPAGSGEVEERG